MTRPAPGCCDLVADPPHADAERVDVGMGEALYRCGAEPAHAVELPTPAGRRNALGGPYCDAHGGHERADREARAEWVYAAPASVGDEDAVLAAGSRGLRTPHCYVVLRQENDAVGPAVWHVRITPEQSRALRDAIGAQRVRDLGLATRGYNTPDELRARDVADRVAYAIDERPQISSSPAGTVERRGWLAYLGVGSMMEQVGSVHASRDAAYTAALSAWHDGLDAELEAISRARGHALDWGIPVTPRPEPIVVEPRPGETSWDAAIRTERELGAKVPRSGVDVFRGARGDGGFAG